jgi:peptidoglycan/LPS O-acetylase OafA/YrhL
MQESLTYDERLQQRIFGLDLIRGGGISLIVLYHGLQLWAKFYPSIWILGFPAYYALEFFFVLSGFLIGTILFDKLFRLDKYGFSETSVFMGRRWWRTLPSYYLILFLILFLAKHELQYEAFPDNYLRFVFFAQNISGTANTFFPESWSLAVEEWFYIILGIAALIIGSLIHQSKKRSLAFLCFILIFLVLVLVTRSIYVLNYPCDFEMQVHKILWMRLDAPMYGVLMAWIFYLHREKLMAIKNKLLVMGLLLLIAALLVHKTDFFSGIRSVIFWPLASSGISLLTPWFIQLRDPGGKISQLIRYLSKVSYSFYLLHLSVVMFAFVMPVFEINTKTDALIASISYLTTTIVLGILNYELLEKKLLRWRDRVLK